jgi:hypothetical protein
MTAKPKQETVVELLRIDVAEFDVRVVGTSPLIVHRFSEKARKQIEDKQQKRAKQAKEARDPHEEYLASLYVFPGDVAGVEGARYGVPAVWFKLAMVGACRYADGLTMTAARGAFHVLGESPESGGLVLLHYSDLRMRPDAVTIGMGSRDMRYRGEFSNWWVRLKIRYNASVVSPDQLINLLNASGFGCGIGERRPQQKCSDQFGMFAVEA